MPKGEMDLELLVQSIRLDDKIEASNEAVDGEGGVATTKGKGKKKKKGGKEKDILELPESLLFEIKQISEDAGRGVVSKCDIAIGTCLLSEFPYSHTIMAPYKDEYCLACFKTINARTARPCTKCRQVSYCSDKCKTSDASSHGIGCEAYKKIPALEAANGVDENLLRWILATHIQYSLREKEATRVNTTGGATVQSPSYSQMKYLVSNKGKYPEEFLQTVRTAVRVLQPLLPPAAHMSEDEAIDFACRCNSNSYSITDDQQNVGFGLFPILSMFNHSCAPNCIFSSHLGGFVSLHNIKPIKAGEQLTVHYVDLYRSTADRRADLLATKYFKCMCERCTVSPDVSPDRFLSGLCCSNCPVSDDNVLLLGDPSGGESDSGGGKKRKKKNKKKKTAAATNLSDATAPDAGDADGDGVEEGEDDCATASSIPPSVPSTTLPTPSGLTCKVCGVSYEKEEALAVIARATEAYNAGLALSRRREYSKCRVVLEHFINDNVATMDSSTSSELTPKLLLHPFHETHFNALALLINACNFERDYGGSSKNLKTVLRCIETAFPPNFPERASYFLALGMALQKGGDKEGAKTAYRKCKDIREIALGTGHPLTDEAVKALRSVS